MHTIIHRALAPQTVAYAWLVLTVALAFALATAHSAAAAGSALPAFAPRVALAAPAAHPAEAPPARPGADRCRATATADDPRATWRLQPPDARPCAPRAGTSAPAGLAISALPPFAPARTHRADALAAVYGGAGPHGPPAAGLEPTILLVAPLRATSDLVPPTPGSAATPSAPAPEVLSTLMPATAPIA